MTTEEKGIDMDFVEARTASYEVEESFDNDLRHSERGPAIFYADGTVEFFLEGKLLTISEWCDKLNKSEPEKAVMLLKYSNKMPVKPDPPIYVPAEYASKAEV